MTKTKIYIFLNFEQTCCNSLFFILTCQHKYVNNVSPCITQDSTHTPRTVFHADFFDTAKRVQPPSDTSMKGVSTRPSQSHYSSFRCVCPPLLRCLSPPLLRCVSPPPLRFVCPPRYGEIGSEKNHATPHPTRCP